MGWEERRSGDWLGRGVAEHAAVISGQHSSVASSQSLTVAATRRHGDTPVFLASRADAVHNRIRHRPRTPTRTGTRTDNVSRGRRELVSAPHCPPTLRANGQGRAQTMGEERGSVIGWGHESRHEYCSNTKQQCGKAQGHICMGHYGSTHVDTKRCCYLLVGTPLSVVR
ncbi:hypothetical protein MRB53_041315 [Persea americana]|nr:hypothetical protein MRB53_041315 [Persea americana]